MITIIPLRPVFLFTATVALQSGIGCEAISSDVDAIDGTDAGTQGATGTASSATSSGPSTASPTGGSATTLSTSAATTSNTSATQTGASGSTGANTSSGSTGTDRSDTGSGDTTGTAGPFEGDVDLGDYVAATDVQSIPAPGNDASGIAWNDDTDRVWIVQNGAARIFEYAADDFSAPIRSIRVMGGGGTDTEGLVYLGNGEVALSFEGGYGVYIADIPDGDTAIDVPAKQTLTLAPPPGVGNNGLEGIAYDRANEVFYAVGEGQDNAAPRRFFRFDRPTDTTTNFTWQDPELVVTEPFDADTALPGNGGSLDLAGIAFDDRDGRVLIVSHTGTRVIQVDTNGDGTILSELDLPPNQWEGVTLIGGGYDLMVVGETNEIQRYVYEP